MNDIDALLRLPATLHDAGHHEAALAQYEALRDRASLSPCYWNNRGNTLLELNRHAEAHESYRRALELCPGLTESRIAMATCLQALGRCDEALAVCDAVLNGDPAHAEAHWNRALLLLLRGAYREGFQEYEWRWRRSRFTSPARHLDIPRWQGESPAGRRLLVHAEQGFGDTLQFVRYLPLLVEQGAFVVLECHPQLVELMGTVAAGIEVVPFGSGAARCDWQVPLLSLPLLFGTAIDTVPGRTPYLAAPPARRLFWDTVLGRTSGAFSVGICWQGKAYPDPGRSCPVECLEALGRVAGVEYFSLQADRRAPAPPFPCHDFSGALMDFADTAALISRLDLVISIDTSVAHLAGALGTVTWAMLPYAPDWRWGERGTSSPWYPEMTLFRMETMNDWPALVLRVAARLEDAARDRLQRTVS